MVADKPSGERVRRVLVLCTGNSARSQIAEALLVRAGGGQIVSASAGTHPAERVHPDAVALLAKLGIDWSAARPKSIDAVMDEPWDIVITVCDSAQEGCPVFPGGATMLHWGMPDPAGIDDPDERKRAFREVALVLSRRIELMLALRPEELSAMAYEERLRQIGHEEVGDPTG